MSAAASTVPALLRPLLAASCAGLLAGLLAGVAAAQTGSFSVFVLAGQSNMEGKVQNKLLEHQARDPLTAPLFAHLRRDDAWVVRDDVFVEFLGNRGGLTIGFGSRDRSGVELEFGAVVGDRLDEPVLLIKAAWGGHSLDVDFRPPSSGLPDEAELQRLLEQARQQTRQRNEKNHRDDPLPTREDIVQGHGRSYRAMLEQVRTTLAEAGTRFPQLAGRRPVMRGFVWHQGWNDQYEGREQRYAENLRNLVADVRRDLAAPALPFVIAVMGQNGSRPAKGAMLTIQRAQLAAAQELAGVAAVRTDDLVDRRAEELYPRWKEELERWERTGSDHAYHYLGSAIWHLRIGRELGAAMLRLLDGDPATTWPQGAGPRGDWSATGPLPPLRFSGRTGEGIRWRTPLPETGQGGIAVAGGRVFVATMAPWHEVTPLDEAERARFGHAIENRAVVGKDIDAHCLDADTGALLWTRRIAGAVPSIYSYPFSDATSASPVTDGRQVWFTNAGGKVACLSVDGEPRWERAFAPTFDGPFNKQYEPFLVRDGDRQVLVHMEPVDAPDAAGQADARWHHLFGLDAATGAVLWRSQDALTHYNAPTLLRHDGQTCILHARGGPHAVPERPVGLSLTWVTGPHAGEAVWRYEDPRGNHEASLQTMASDARHVYWLLKEPRNLLVVLDRATGEPLREISLVQGVTRTSRDPDSGEWRSEVGADLDKGVFPARYSLIPANGRVFFQCYATAWGKPVIGPEYSFARIDPGGPDRAPRVEYLEVPTDVTRDGNGEAVPVWRTRGAARAINSRGEEVTGDERSRWDGWDWVFNGSPTRVGDRLHFTLASGVVYVLDAAAVPFDRHALLAVDDVGPAGATWTANSVSYADGRLYHRTARELLCIGDR